MKTLTEEQLAKLPKWAQEHIKDLTRERDSAVNGLKDYLDSQSESLVWTGNWMEKNYLQTDKVTFRLPNGEIEVNLRDDHLRCFANFIRGQFVVVPSCTNVLDLKITKNDP